MEQRQAPHIAILQSPGMGHLIPHIEFAKRLILQHHFSVTLIVPTDGPLSKAQTTFLESLPTGMDYVLLDPVIFDDLSDDVRIETRICLTLTHSLPSLRDVIRSLVETTNLVALVVDGLGTDALDVAKEHNIPSYIFFTSPALCYSFVYYLPKLDQEYECEYKDLSEPIQLPGCIPIHGKDLYDAAQDRKNDVYKWILHHAKRYNLAEGIILNTFKDLEEEALEALQEPEPGKPPIYPIGPLIQMNYLSNKEDDDRIIDGSGCLKWLDDQPNSSVLFVSFGSGGTLAYDQFIELALGLELSEQRFIWVIRSPNEKSASAAFFGVQNQDDPLALLPEGFVERIKGRGLLVPSWAPQAKILGHGSTGGFLTHCGWNSVLESLMNGMPLMAWPLYAEQKMNAIMLTEDLKVAMWPKASENCLVGRAEIADVARNLMAGEEGKAIRNRVRVLRDSANKAISEDGVSTKIIAELARKWKDM